MSKIAAAVLAFAGLILFSVPMSAQFGGLLPTGNVYGGGSYAQLTNVINKQSYKGWNASFEALPFTRFPHVGLVADGSGFYRQGATQYNIVGGPRLSAAMGKWRPFVQAMAGIRHLNSNGVVYQPLVIDVGGGVDYRLWFKNFSWRFQGDYMHTHYSSYTQNDYRTSTGIVWRF
ncbi:MAG TPA: hypothetical protein VE377_05640 [Candidatus Dormibacteraeota bacterium]|nr:hypothetical protein [Candidatus Dormibacteraeota bacterium]